jgi:3-methyladenine DNA glycosylase AlkD
LNAREAAGFLRENMKALDYVPPFGYIRKKVAPPVSCIHPDEDASKQSERSFDAFPGRIYFYTGSPIPGDFSRIARARNEAQMTPAGESHPVGVPGLAQEIEDELRSLRSRDAESIRAIRRDFSKRLTNAAPHVVKELAMLLLELPGFEYRLIAYELIHHHSDALFKLNAWELEQMGRGIGDWGAADCFAVFLAGPMWRERRIPNSLVHDWARAADRWWRRIALVSTVPLNSKARGGSGDPHRTLQVCRMLEKDRDPMVVKAMSWALRELAKTDARTARSYLAERESVLAPRVVREVRNKLTTGKKDPGRGTKTKTGARPRKPRAA